MSALVGSLALAGCSDDGPDPAPAPGPGGAGRGIDARAYFEDYESGEDDDGVLYSQSQPEAYADGAAPGRSSGGVPGSVVPGPGLPGPPPGPGEDNVFVEAGTSGFVETSQDARSTFALDVDSGSWGVARTLLEAGEQPPPAAIRVEEWVNAQPHADPVPTDADLALSTETGVSPSADDTQLVRIGVTAREVAPAQRRPVNVTLVVDRSGSMDIRERLGLVKASLALLADQLRDDDIVSVVSFEDQATPILEPTKVRDTDALLEAIDELKPGGSTNLVAGLELGYEQARESFREEATNVVLLASDGVANVGVTGPDAITERIAEESADGIHLVTVGFGMGNYNDHLMEQLADRGDGFYGYVDDFEEAERLFVDELTTTLVPVAEDAKAQVSFDPERVSSYRLIGYDNRALADEEFVDPGVDAGELGSGHHATALYEVRLADGVADGESIGEAQLRWRSPDGSAAGGGGGQQQASIDLVAADPQSPPSPAWSLVAATADLAQVMKGAAPVADRGITIDDLRGRIDPLVADEVPGAEELLALLELVESTVGLEVDPEQDEPGPQ
ncbi:vWA domain-containing protein [Nocardioides pacificus]